MPLTLMGITNNEQNDFQLGMHDDIFSFKGLNHLSKSSTIFWLVIIHAKGTHV